MDEIYNFWQEMVEKYNIAEEDAARFDELIAGNPEELYGDEWAAEEADEESAEDFD